jgi:hypothetical protein
MASAMEEFDVRWSVHFHCVSAADRSRGVRSAGAPLVGGPRPRVVRRLQASSRQLLETV